MDHVCELLTLASWPVAKSIAALSASSETQAMFFINIIHSFGFAQMCVMMYFYLEDICHFAGGASVLHIFP